MLEPYIATCPLELQEVLSEELGEKGAVDIEQGFKAVHFKATTRSIYQMHRSLRIASRLFKVIKQGSGASLAIITNQASKLKWDQYFKPDSTYLIEGVIGDRDEKAPSATQISKAVRLGLEDYFKYKKLPIPQVDLKQPKIKIIAFIHQKRLTISIDTSGKAFHKRGYKNTSHPAPVKETLAAAILRLAGYDGSQIVLDPMCGSGTIIIEAAMMALNKAPLIHRKKGEFALENLKGFEYGLWRKCDEKMREDALSEPKMPIFAADVDPRYLADAQENALRARVEKHIGFKQLNFLGSKPPCEEPGLLVTNLPYGARISGKGQTDELDAAKDFYTAFGDNLKRNYAGWKAAVLVAIDSPYKFIGLRPSRKIPLKNGGIDCRLLIFEMYSGSKKTPKPQKSEN